MSANEEMKLLSPFSTGFLDFRNRIVLAPMTRARAGESRIPNELMAEYYAQRASAGLIITEATSISEQALGWVNSPGIYTEEMDMAWEQVVEAVHEKEGKIFLQLWHCGRASHSDFHGGEPTVAPSSIKIEGDEIHTPKGKKPHETPRALETDEIPALIEDYVNAAERAHVCGFDGVEIHSANGYLLDTFLQSKTNHRTDEYGGSMENRLRLLIEIIDGINERLGSENIGVRLSPNGIFNDMGSPDYREQFLYAAAELNKKNLSYLHVMDGLAFGFHELGDPMTLDEFREVFDGPIIGNCGYTRETAEAAVADGKADMIAFGRPYISNPDLPERFAAGAELNPDADQSDWYQPKGADGYTDFPTLDS